MRQRPYGLQILKYLLSEPSQKKFADTWFISSNFLQWITMLKMENKQKRFIKISIVQWFKVNRSLENFKKY